jgi:hypothetical protein
MPGVGALPKESFVSEFAARSFTVKVMDYNGFNHRLQVPPRSARRRPPHAGRAWRGACLARHFQRDRVRTPRRLGELTRAACAQVPKLTEYIVPEESKLVVKTNTLIVRLKKVKADYFWYELHKTKGIGETEEK